MYSIQKGIAVFRILSKMSKTLDIRKLGETKGGIGAFLHKKESKTLDIRKLGETKGGIGAFLHKKDFEESLLNVVTTRAYKA